MPVEYRHLSILPSYTGAPLFLELIPELELQDTWAKHTPLLRSLSLDGTQCPKLLLTHPPPLQHLGLGSCAFQWNLPLSSALTSLSITKPATLVSPEHLLSRLTGLPELTKLTLDTVLSLTPLQPGITRLLEAPSRYVSALEFAEQPPDSDEDPILTAMRFTRYQPPTLTREVTKYLDLSSLQELELSQMPLSIRSLGFPASFDGWPRTFGKLPMIQYLKVIQYAAYHLVKFFGDKAKEIKRNVYKEEEKEEMRLSLLAGGFSEELAQRAAYSRREPEEYRPLSTTPSFPALRDLVLTFPSQKEDEDDGEGEDFQEHRVDDENIIYNLTRRFDKGTGLERLAVSNWPIDNETLEKLEGVVGQVLWGLLNSKIDNSPYNIYLQTETSRCMLSRNSIKITTTICRSALGPLRIFYSPSVYDSP
ncbi:hypothetical protein BDN72DRAFT_962721, partial [Pluteus cervinus]